MLIPPQLRLGAVVPPRLAHARVIRHRIRGFVLLLRVLLLCMHTAAHADKVLPASSAPSAPRTASNFLEAVATDYANSQVFHAVEGIVPVRETRALPAEPSPQTPVSSNAILPAAPANIRRVNVQ